MYCKLRRQRDNYIYTGHRNRSIGPCRLIQEEDNRINSGYRRKKQKERQKHDSAQKRDKYRTFSQAMERD
jgi:hypothetical protein